MLGSVFTGNNLQARDSLVLSSSWMLAGLSLYAVSGFPGYVKLQTVQSRAMPAPAGLQVCLTFTEPEQKVWHPYALHLASVYIMRACLAGQLADNRLIHRLGACVQLGMAAAVLNKRSFPFATAATQNLGGHSASALCQLGLLACFSMCRNNLAAGGCSEVDRAFQSCKVWSGQILGRTSLKFGPSMQFDHTSSSCNRSQEYCAMTKCLLAFGSLLQVFGAGPAPCCRATSFSSWTTLTLV